MLDKEDNTFVCVFIDEIESLASTRQQPTNSSEPQDTLRVSVPDRAIRELFTDLLIFKAVNALLIAFDSLRNRPNVVVLCTSNLIKAMARSSPATCVISSVDFPLLGSRISRPCR